VARFLRLTLLLLALALVGFVPAASVAGAQPTGNRVIMSAAMAPMGTTDIIGRGYADIREPVDWAVPPGTYSFDGVNGTKYRNVVERVFFWPWWDEQGNRANWAFVWGHNCAFSTDGPPMCQDVAWAFVDYANPRLKDFQITCWWDDGVRPQGDTWDICNAPTAHQGWTQVVNGSLIVQMKK
jgi:hypothetical protein